MQFVTMGLLPHVGDLGVLGAVIAVGWPAIQFMLQRRRESRERQFETYHRLVRDLVVGDSDSAVPKIDRQAAVVFELRNFPRYYAYTERMLSGLKEDWRSVNPRLIKEIDLTLEYIRENWRYRFHKITSRA